MERNTGGNQPITNWSVLLALTCSTIWAGQAVAVKLSLVDMPPNFVMGLRFLLAVPVLALAAVVLGRNPDLIQPCSTRPWRHLGLIRRTADGLDGPASRDAPNRTPSDHETAKTTDEPAP